MNKIQRWWQENAVIVLSLLCVVFFLWGFFGWITIRHYEEEHIPHNSQCQWGTCRYYDGSDFLHDFRLHGWPYKKGE